LGKVPNNLILSAMASYIQKIIFGSPGTSKSYLVREIATKKLGIGSLDIDDDISFPDKSDDRSAGVLPNSVKVVFHPEYGYSDFMGKLLPLSSGNSIIYKYYPGHFLQALGMAYKGLVNNKSDNYLLVIDELNRGNASAIFGSIFQLLDRENDGWSTYEIDISEMELIGLLNGMGFKAEATSTTNITVDGSNIDKFFNDSFLAVPVEQNKSIVMDLLSKRKIKIPPNLSIIATINTSDESIYYLDSAFKRRWDWQYIDAPCKEHINNASGIPEEIFCTKLSVPGLTLDWCLCIAGVNEFLKSHHQAIRRIEEKQIGWWFIKPVEGKVTIEQVQDKLMFYLWDGVFARDKKILTKYIEEKLGKKNVNLVTYADFLKYTSQLLIYWHDSVTALFGGML
jgi:5-methylcytosine-specific restriction enzyme B